MSQRDANGSYNGGGGSDSLIIGGDLIPMTLQGNGNLRLAESMQQHFHTQQRQLQQQQQGQGQQGQAHFSRFDSIPLGTPQQYLPGSLNRSQGMLAFEAVS